jgi:hypothetical protein
MPRLYGTKDVRVAAYNRKASKYFLELAESVEKARFFTAQASLVYSAFTHEAFLNQLGKRQLKDWADHEWDPVQAKLKAICKHVGHSKLSRAFFDSEIKLRMGVTRQWSPRESRSQWREHPPSMPFKPIGSAIAQLRMRVRLSMTLTQLP